VPTAIVPEEAKPAVASTVTAVPEPPVPAVSAFNDPSNSLLLMVRLKHYYLL